MGSSLENLVNSGPYVSFLSKFHNLSLLAYLATPSTSVASMPASSSSCSGAGVVANTTELQLTDREKARLDELFLASRALVEPVEHERDVCNSIFHI